MADKYTSNVVPIGGRDSSLTMELSKDTATLLAVSRDMLVDGVIAVFIQHAGRANEEFLNMADRAANVEQRQICFAAVHLLSQRPQHLLAEFRNAYLSRFDSCIGISGNSRPRQNTALPDELRLIDHDEFEQDLAISKLSARASFNCSQQLVALDRRLAALLRLERIRQDDNPLHPGQLFHAMLQGAMAMDIERPVALALLQSFERQTAAELPGIYAGINRALAQSGVLPTMASESAPTFGHPAGAAVSAGPVGGGYAPAGGPTLQSGVPVQAGTGYGGQVMGGLVGAGAARPLAAPIGEDVFSQLLRVLQSGAAAPPGAGGVPGAPPALPGGLGGGYSPTISANQLVDALGVLQRGQADPSSLPGLGQIPFDPQGNVLRQFRSTPMANWSHPMDAMTIDIVSMLFDAIFNDPDLSATVRAEIAKLQIPVLKVALLDKSLFSDRKHPARRLLDLIANSGIGRSEDDEPRLLAKISSIVGAVVEGFDSDVQIFASQAQELESFLRDEETRAHDKSIEMAAQLAERERKEIAPTKAAAEVGVRTKRRNLPPLIADFLSRNWRLVLVETFVRAGETSPDWTESVRLMDDLIWSVEPKKGSQDRDRLLSLLPNMLKRLRAGLERVDLEGTWDAFFSELIKLHVSALHNDVPTELLARNNPSLPGQAAPAIPAARTPPPAVPASAAHVLPPSELVPEPHSEPAPATDDESLQLVQALEVGAWVEFQSLRGVRNTLRLSWVSEFKRVYLFTNRQGENAMTLAVASLADHLRKGSARLLSQNPLTDRAVAQVLEKAKPAAEPGAKSPTPGYAWE